MENQKINDNLNINNVEFKNFTLIRDDKNILENLDFKILKGKYILEGKNGIGKSTLFDCIYKMDITYLGNIYINDINLRKINSNVLHTKYIGYVNQEIKLIDNISIKENIELFQKESKFKNLILKDIEETLNINIKNKISKLSGGEKQYINILINIVNEKPILLIDEPFNNLSKAKIEKIVDILDKDNRFIICVAHKEIALNKKGFKKISFSKRKLENV